MPRSYKYQAPKKTTGVQFLRFVEGKAKKLTVSLWEFPKGKQYLFRCYITMEDGEQTDKIWTVWDYESTRRLKKKLGAKTGDSKDITVTMRMEDDESTYEIA
jgi:hypothetical protein